MSVKTTLAVIVTGVLLGFAAPAATADGPNFGNQEPDPAITDGSAAKAFRQARARWLSSGVRNYRMTIRRSCFCMGPQKITVTVRRGKVVKKSLRRWWGPRTVPGLFKVVHGAIAEGAAVLDVTYNRKLGYVRNTWIDYSAMLADEEVGYRVTGFKRL